MLREIRQLQKDAARERDEQNAMEDALIDFEYYMSSKQERAVVGGGVVSQKQWDREKKNAAKRVMKQFLRVRHFDAARFGGLLARINDIAEG